MISLSKDEVIFLHDKLIRETGGAAGIKDEKALDVILQKTFQGSEETAQYSVIVRKAAQLCYGLIKTRPFEDGNRRLGIYALLIFLELNGIKTNISGEELAVLGTGIATGEIEYEGVVLWIISYDK